MDKYIVGFSADGPIQNAGGKFPTDIVRIFKQGGYQYKFVHEQYSLKSYFWILFDVIRLVSIKRQSLVVYVDQVEPRISRTLVYYFLLRKKCKIIPLFEDINILRNKYSQKEQQSLVNTLKKSECIISQNSRMTAYLRTLGIKAPAVELAVLDFLSDRVDDSQVHKGSEWTICYGGNLIESSSGFLFKIPCSENITYNIYGFNLSDTRKLPDNVFYKGKFDGNNCIGNLRGDWGLVWNGRSIDIDPNDIKSTYYNYVSPHKFSMYLLCGMPVIVYSGSAMAEFVNVNKCGIVIDSIKDIEKQLGLISEKEYQMLKNNAISIARKIAAGYFTNQAIAEMEKIVGV